MKFLDVIAYIVVAPFIVGVFFAVLGLGIIVRVVCLIKPVDEWIERLSRADL